MKTGKTTYGNSLVGLGEVQMYQTNQSYNGDVTNVNGQLSDD